MSDFAKSEMDAIPENPLRTANVADVVEKEEIRPGNLMIFDAEGNQWFGGNAFASMQTNALSEENGGILTIPEISLTTLARHAASTKKPKKMIFPKVAMKKELKSGTKGIKAAAKQEAPPIHQIFFQIAQKLKVDERSERAEDERSERNGQSEREDPPLFSDLPNSELDPPDLPTSPPEKWIPDEFWHDIFLRMSKNIFVKHFRYYPNLPDTLATSFAVRTNIQEHQPPEETLTSPKHLGKFYYRIGTREFFVNVVDDPFETFHTIRKFIALKAGYISNVEKLELEKLSREEAMHIIVPKVWSQIKDRSALISHFCERRRKELNLTQKQVQELTYTINLGIFGNLLNDSTIILEQEIIREIKGLEQDPESGKFYLVTAAIPTTTARPRPKTPVISENSTSAPTKSTLAKSALSKSTLTKPQTISSTFFTLIMEKLEHFCIKSNIDKRAETPIHSAEAPIELISPHLDFQKLALSVLISVASAFASGGGAALPDELFSQSVQILQEILDEESPEFQILGKPESLQKLIGCSILGTNLEESIARISEFDAGIFDGDDGKGGGELSNLTKTKKIQSALQTIIDRIKRKYLQYLVSGCATLRKSVGPDVNLAFSSKIISRPGYAIRNWSKISRNLFPKQAVIIDARIKAEKIEEITRKKKGKKATVKVNTASEIVEELLETKTGKENPKKVSDSSIPPESEDEEFALPKIFRAS